MRWRRWSLKVPLLVLALSTLAYFQVNRPGRFQVAPIDGATFVVLDTATGAHIVYKDNKYSGPSNFAPVDSGVASSIEYRLRVK